MRIIVFGANGPTGRLITRRTLDAGHTVTAVTRQPDAFDISGGALTVQRADVHDTAAVSRVMADHDVVLSSLGVPYGRHPIDVYSSVAAKILSAMAEHGIRRFACVSSSATVPNPNADEGFLFGRVLQPFITKTLGKTLYADMARMEQLVMASDTDWTILRPSGLFDAESVSDYRVSAEPLPGRFTSRADLADLLLRQATDDTYARSPVSLITDDGAPSVRELILREAFGRETASR